MNQRLRVASARVGNAARASVPSLLLIALVGTSACVQRPWDVALLEQRYTALGGISGHRLGDATPYVLPSQGGLVFFLCRWPSNEPIPVSFPPDASDAERRGLESVLRAWEGAGLGVRFNAGAPPRSGIEIRFIEPDADTTATTQAANTIADCAVAPAAVEAPTDDVLPARLVFASIHLWRGGYDAIGRPVPHSQAEFVGSALHEFGHALGFQGHARVGKSVMVKEVDASRRAGQRLLKGAPFEDHTLRALYAVPSGTVVKRASVGRERTERFDRMERLARERGLEGPLLRVGDLDGRIAWRDGAGVEYALRIYDVRRMLRSPESFWLRPTWRTSELLEDPPGSARSP